MGYDVYAVIGGGNGGQASAADMALQGRKVRLYEFPEYAANLDAVKESRRITIHGDVEGEAELELVTTI